MVEAEQQRKAYHLQKDEKKPIVVFQKEIQQIAHRNMVYDVWFMMHDIWFAL